MIDLIISAFQIFSVPKIAQAQIFRITYSWPCMRERINKSPLVDDCAIPSNIYYSFYRGDLPMMPANLSPEIIKRDWDLLHQGTQTYVVPEDGQKYSFKPSCQCRLGLDLQINAYNQWGENLGRLVSVVARWEGEGNCQINYSGQTLNDFLDAYNHGLNQAIAAGADRNFSVYYTFGRYGGSGVTRPCTGFDLEKNCPNLNLTGLPIYFGQYTCKPS